MYEELEIIEYPDPRLRKMSKRVETFDENLRTLAERMFVLMREHKGVGLAAAQVGVNVRLFVMNHSGKPEDDRVYVNPVLLDATGEEEGEEGCLSLPDINTMVVRAKTLRMEGQDLEGNAVVETETGYRARIWQHETDHLNGTMIIDRMGPTAKMTSKKKLKVLEDRYAKEHPAPIASKGRARR
ncbi:MAG TPA: peptide deformylase [Tepidisphaeraceae bacterium]|jgi:peptide deformylase|nr:peptide deformylase [Tepidisphaeraceae bacterium]